MDQMIFIITTWSLKPSNWKRKSNKKTFRLVNTCRPLTGALRHTDGSVLVFGIRVGFHLKRLLVIDQSPGTLRHTGSGVIEMTTCLYRNTHTERRESKWNTKSPKVKLLKYITIQKTFMARRGWIIQILVINYFSSNVTKRSRILFLNTVDNFFMACCYIMCNYFQI